MGSKTKISYVHSTINGSSGCDGCELWNGTVRSCYAAQVHENRLAKSLPELYAPKFEEVRMIPGRFAKAAAWGPPTAKEIEGKPWLAGKPRHIFVGDMGDFLSSAVTVEFLARELFGAIESNAGKRHVWMLLTKRPARLAALSEVMGGFPDNVIAMTTVTDQRTANVRVRELLKVRCKTKGLSMEPLLGPVDLGEAGLACDWACPECGSRSLDPDKQSMDGRWWECFDCHETGMGEPAWTPLIQWVACGGESGAGARPMHPDWVRSIRDQCRESGVAFFFKQWGEWGLEVPTYGGDLGGDLRSGIVRHVCADRENDGHLRKGDVYMRKFGKEAAGCVLDGVEHHEMPKIGGVA